MRGLQTDQTAQVIITAHAFMQNLRRGHYEPDRCRSAGIPDGLAFATKPQLAVRMIQRALDAGTPALWVAGDEVYGDNPHLRTALENRRTGYVLAVSSTHPVLTHAGKFPAKSLAARIPKRAWQQLSAGAGAEGERYYDWARIEIHNPTSRLGQWRLPDPPQPPHR